MKVISLQLYRRFMSQSEKDMLDDANQAYLEAINKRSKCKGKRLSQRQLMSPHHKQARSDMAYYSYLEALKK